jgi:hypothetical protein
MKSQILRDELTKKKHKQTMGNLKNELINVVEFSEETKQYLSDLVDIRNYLAHQYFWDKSVIFSIPERCQGLIDELNEFVERFKVGEIFIDKLLIEIVKSKGFTEKYFSEVVELIKNNKIQKEKDTPNSTLFWKDS